MVGDSIGDRGVSRGISRGDSAKRVCRGGGEAASEIGRRGIGGGASSSDSSGVNWTRRGAAEICGGGEIARLVVPPIPPPVRCCIIPANAAAGLWTGLGDELGVGGPGSSDACCAGCGLLGVGGAASASSI